MKPMQVDVVIVGAGVNGLMMAGLLADADKTLNIAIIEAVSFDINNVDETLDPKVLALTLASKSLLERIHIWNDIDRDRIGLFRKMHVWDESGEGRVEFQAEDLAQQSLAYTVESRLLQIAMLRRISEKKNIIIFQPASVRSIEFEEDKASIQLEDGSCLETSLVIAADGQRSQVREMAGISYVSESYEQKAIVCIIETEEPHGDIARQRFLTEGILALLPMAKNNRCAIVWSMKTNRADELLAMSEEDFNQALQQASEHVLGRVNQTEMRAAFPLRSGQAEHYCQARLALVGDAAHSVHPLAGQGANLGFMDAAVLTEVLIKARRRSADIGNHSILRPYERWRRGENIFMMNVFSGFKWLFEQQFAPMPLLRNTGLKLFNHCQPIKQGVMQRAMGLTGDLPEMLR